MKFISFAKKLARRSTHEQFRHATIIVKGGAVLSYGYNHRDIHSEIMALNKLWPSKRVGTTLINIRLGKDGSFRNSQPCLLCHKEIKESRVARVYYTDSNGELRRL